MNIVINTGFLEKISTFPNAIQKKINTFIKKYEQCPFTTGSNFEKINTPNDKKIYSLRVDITYRVICAYEGDTIIMLYVDHHDEAYDWANKKRIEINKSTGRVQLYEVVESVEERKVEVAYLFDKCTDEQLIALGLPELQLKYVRSIVEPSELYANKAKFSSDVYEALEFLVDNDYNDVYELLHQEDVEIPSTISQALRNGHSNDAYTVISTTDELQKLLDAPLEKWRVFLHPSQKNIVEKEYNGPAKITGEAGTGKTVVAMHRAKRLLKDGKKVLFTTFTKNLVSDIENNIKSILSIKEVRNLDIENVDSLAISYLKNQGLKVKLEYDEKKLLDIWNEAIKKGNCNLEFDNEFFMQEWYQIISQMENVNMASYLIVPRVGRGIRLDRAKRLMVWRVVEEYFTILKDREICDIDYAIAEARRLLKLEGVQYYDSIICDEAQDISPNAFKFLRLLVGPEHANDLFICGDSHQRIYKYKASLNKCGINVKGRSFILKINYRTTEEIKKYAFSFLKGYSFDELDDDEITKTSTCKSLSHGENPLLKEFETVDEQNEFVINEVDKIVNSGEKLENICIVSRSHKQLDILKSKLNSSSIDSYEIDKDSDLSDYEGIRLATMHRVKGLEFKYIFVISVNKNIIPKTKVMIDKSQEDDRLLIERCLLYVALTRAQKKAYVLSYGEKSVFLD